MNDHDEDLRRARLYLQLDPDEMQNVRAEHEKYERRKQAMKRGDSGSLIEPRSYDPAMPFTPVQCVTCGVKLTSQNHSAALTCHECVAHEARIQHNIQTTIAFETAQRAVRQAKKLAESKTAAKAVMFWVCVAIGGGMIVAWVLNKAFFAVGGAL